ncbi:hypothetical protein ACQ4WX_10435 [Streptomyces lasalocidi]
MVGDADAGNGLAVRPDARPEPTELGLPRVIFGAFASVFSLTSAASGRWYAVKCLTRHVPDREGRRQAISSRLAPLDPAELSRPWNLGFEYLPDAIGVGPTRGCWARRAATCSARSRLTAAEGSMDSTPELGF